MEFENYDLEKARQALLRNKPDLVINCVPKDTLDRFKALAEEQFKDNKTGFAHYGYALKWLVDLYAPRNIELEARVMRLEEEVENLKNQPKEKFKAIKLGDGNTIKIPIKEKE